MDAPEPTRRRWQSHEWNVLAVIAIIAALGLVWLGWQAAIVQHRRAILEQLFVRHDAAYAEEAEGIHVRLDRGPVVLIQSGDPDFSLSAIRRLLGDERVGGIGFKRPLTAADREAVEAFPEAEVVEATDSPAAR